MTPRGSRFRPGVESLETRENPSSLLKLESFESSTPPFLPAGWQDWSAGSDFLTSRLTAATGTTSLASAGSLSSAGRTWWSEPFAADASVAVRVRSDGPAPVGVLARGQNLDTTTPSYLGVVLGPGGRRLDLIEVLDGNTRILGTVQSAGVFGPWLEVTLKPSGSSAAVQLQRIDTGQYLNAQGQWQATPADTLQATVTRPPAAGLAGITRSPGGQGMVFVDDFKVLAPPGKVIRESFDTTAVGNRPAGWQGWTNDGSAGFATSTGRFVSPANGFAAGGGSVTAARAWLQDVQPADVQVSAALFADSLIPGTLLVRGSGLDGSKPTYYGVTLVRGLEVRLVRVVDGVETTLASSKSDTYVSSEWVRLTLTATGNQLRVVVYRPGAGLWLSPDGDWQGTPQPALEATDAAITADGLVGLSRGRLAAGAITFDDVEVRPASSVVGPRITVTASQPGSVFSGDVTFRVLGDADAPPRRIEFRLDGRLRAAYPAVPAAWELDTTLLANGPHELVVRALDEAGNVSTVTRTFTADNPNPQPPPDRPELPRKLSHIRIAQLAYFGNPMGAFEQTQLRNAVDLVIPNAKYLGTIDQASPTTPQLVYSNLSNLYQGLLTDWLGYADRVGAAREAAFYHVTQATPFLGASPSSQPVTWFWSAYRGPANSPTSGQVDVTSAARGGQVRGVTFGAAGEAVAIGYTDRFREINFLLSRAAAAGWQAVFEYPSAVAADGTPTEWKPLTTSDGTGGLARSGRVTFSPPADWKTARMGASSIRYYYVRVRTTTGSVLEAPETRTIMGRDYVGAAGRNQGVIPAFDYAADRDGDGYLSDAEYAGRAPGKDARFVYESRLFYPYYGQMRFLTNPSASAVRRWAADYHARTLTATPLADGFFLDNSSGRLPVSGIPLVEPTATYSEDMAAVVGAVWRAIAPKIVVANTAGGLADADPVAAAATGVLEEFILRPVDATWSSVNDVATLVGRRLNADHPSPYVIVDSHPGGLSTTDPRVRSATLAYYYLLADPDRTMLMFFGGYAPSAPWSQTWIPAATVDVGQPTGAMSVFAEGTDPTNPALAYKVFGREYGKALVLYKPRSYTAGKGTGTLNDLTATTHNLGGNYRVLNSDGTLGPVVTRISLRNGEGVVLMKA